MVWPVLTEGDKKEMQEAVGAVSAGDRPFFCVLAGPFGNSSKFIDDLHESAPDNVAVEECSAYAMFETDKDGEPLSLVDSNIEELRLCNLSREQRRAVYVEIERLIVAAGSSYEILEQMFSKLHLDCSMFKDPGIGADEQRVGFLDCMNLKAYVFYYKDAPESE